MRHIVALAVALCFICTNGLDPLSAQDPVAGEEAKLRRDLHNMMDITKAIHAYALSNGGMLPQTLGDTLPFIDNSTQWQDNREHEKLTLAQKARLYLTAKDAAEKQIPDQVTPAWINENTSYIYVGKAGSKMSDYDAESTVVIHGRLDNGYTVDTDGTGPVTKYPLAKFDASAYSYPSEKFEEILKQFAQH